MVIFSGTPRWIVETLTISDAGVGVYDLEAVVAEGPTNPPGPLGHGNATLTVTGSNTATQVITCGDSGSLDYAFETDGSTLVLESSTFRATAERQ